MDSSLIFTKEFNQSKNPFHHRKFFFYNLNTRRLVVNFRNSLDRNPIYQTLSSNGPFKLVEEENSASLTPRTQNIYQALEAIENYRLAYLGWQKHHYSIDIMSSIEIDLSYNNLRNHDTSKLAIYLTKLGLPCDIFYSVNTLTNNGLESLILIPNLIKLRIVNSLYDRNLVYSHLKVSDLLFDKIEWL